MTADLLLAVDDSPAPLDGVGEDAPVDVVAIPGSRAGLGDHRSCTAAEGIGATPKGSAGAVSQAHAGAGRV